MNNTENTTRPIDTLIGKLNELGYEAQLDEEAKSVHCKNNLNFSVDDEIINTASELIIHQIVSYITLKMEDREKKTEK